MKIEVLGSGCPRCKQTYKIMEMAKVETGINAELVYVTDINEIISRGVMSTPAVAINGKIVVSGKIPTLEEAKQLLG
ncbi:thioredoxin family protein [Marinitoga aeolica]|uniref:TM0996/MTH895 family glutaredoxin-like protein n=1 Tax=Marinitoga aeolica TaxID=2809031 RepID=A0ABY8PSV0_9BACT|nr:thioredoxin family protein [Marinitoga aeolica]WGS65707.1 TM0996/MTH895 family glutaredoxin-like protein [Marinitoga aeolica]